MIPSLARGGIHGHSPLFSCIVLSIGSHKACYCLPLKGGEFFFAFKQTKSISRLLLEEKLSPTGD